MDGSGTCALIVMSCPKNKSIFNQTHCFYMSGPTICTEPGHKRHEKTSHPTGPLKSFSYVCATYEPSNFVHMWGGYEGIRIWGYPNSPPRLTWFPSDHLFSLYFFSFHSLSNPTNHMHAFGQFEGHGCVDGQMRVQSKYGRTLSGRICERLTNPYDGRLN